MNIEYIWFMIALGWLYHRSMKVNEYRTLLGEPLSMALIKQYVKLNLWNAITSALATLIVFLVLYLDIQELVNSETRSAWKLALIMAVTIGYTGDSMVKNVFDAGKSVIGKRLQP